MAKQLMRRMSKAELTEHINRQLRFVSMHSTPDTLGAMLILFQDNGITQYGASVDPETAPEALRELADRLERRETNRRY